MGPDRFDARGAHDEELGHAGDAPSDLGVTCQPVMRMDDYVVVGVSVLRMRGV